MTPSRPKALFRLALLGAALVVALAGCTANDGLTQQYQSGDTKGFISGDGSVLEVKQADRGKVINFTGKSDEGATVTRKQYEGKVVVLNFWYASCPPCRVEAPDLQSLSEKYKADVQFVGVNVRDEADTSRAFARTFKVTYPSIVDSGNAAVQLALAGSRGPNSTPTTIVLDQKGRFAARILGQVDKSVLNTLISDTVTGK